MHSVIVASCNRKYDRPRLQDKLYIDLFENIERMKGK